MRALTALLLVIGASACGRVAPAALDTTNELCASCRMVVSNSRSASQIVAPYQEPIFFDDLGCLNQFLSGSPLPKHARVFVADHRTGDWVDAASAVFSKIDGRAGAMGSSLVAHASMRSREEDQGFAGTLVTLAEALPSFRKTGGPE
jgi:copper chaperone NosL